MTDRPADCAEPSEAGYHRHQRAGGAACLACTRKRSEAVRARRSTPPGPRRASRAEALTPSLGVRFGAEDRELLDREAERRNVTVSALVRELVAVGIGRYATTDQPDCACHVHGPRTGTRHTVEPIEHDCELHGGDGQPCPACGNNREPGNPFGPAPRERWR